jgi:putative transcriptional regulator
VPNLKLKQGSVLLSDPFLKDPNFVRSVILVLEHTDMGSLGFVLNNKLDLTLRKLMNNDDLPEAAIFQGGPVELNTLHFLHTMGSEIPNSVQILPGIFWGGSFEFVVDLLTTNPFLEKEFKFYLGYSGWGEGQLQEELNEEAWVLGKITRESIFDAQNHPPEILWKNLVANLGSKYRFAINSPIDPRMN